MPRCLPLFALMLCAADWPHLRGPTYDGVSPEAGLADAWSEGGPPVLWTREIGQGYSGFVIAGESVFTSSQSKTGMFVTALDAKTGEELWRTRVDWPWQPAGAYPGPYATPTFADGRVFYTTPTGKAGCLDAKSGSETWTIDLRKRFNGKGTEFGYAASPTIEDGKVLLPIGGREASVVALDVKDGSTLWAVGHDEASYCGILPITLGSKRLAVAYMRNAVLLLDPSAGTILHRRELSSHYDEHSAWPLWKEPRLVLAAPFKAGAQCYLLEGGELKASWSSRGLSNDVASSVLYQGNIYGFDLQQLQSHPHKASRGQFKCLDFETGKERWKTDDVGQATVLASDGKLFLLNDTGTLFLIRANAERSEELARARVLDGGLCWTAPALSDGRLFVRNHTKAVCLFVGKPGDAPSPTPSLAVTLRPPGFDWSRLLTREPEFPNDAPTFRVVATWFLVCLLGVFLPALLFCLPFPRRRLAFGVIAFPLGLAGTSLYSLAADTFLFTWPAALFLVFRVLIGVIGWAESQANKRKPRWISRLMLLAFLSLGYGYYRLCLVVGYPVAWGFLIGFLPAAPLAMLATRMNNPWTRAGVDLLAFAGFFFVGGLFPGWKDAAA